MTRRDPRVAIRQMIEHAREATAMVHGRSRRDLDDDRKLELAIIRLLEIVGEAANRVPPDIQQQYAEVPWPEVISLRNRLIHGYDAIDLDIVWEVVSRDLPDLLAELENEA